MSMNRKLRRASSSKKASVAVDIGGTDVRHGGRTLQITVSVNTDEDEMTVLERVRAAAATRKAAEGSS
jgi:hypothetical protein